MSPLSPCGSLHGVIAPVQLAALVAPTPPISLPHQVSSPFKYASLVCLPGSLPLSGSYKSYCLHSHPSSSLHEGCSPVPLTIGTMGAGSYLSGPRVLPLPCTVPGPWWAHRFCRMNGCPTFPTFGAAPLCGSLYVSHLYCHTGQESLVP